MAQEPGLDQTLRGAAAGESTFEDVLDAFLASTLLVVSTVEYDPKSPISPLVLNLPNGAYMVAFSHSDHMGPFEKTAKAVVTMQGTDLVKGIQDPLVGVLLNPGNSLGYQIDGFVVADLARQLS